MGRKWREAPEWKQSWKKKLLSLRCLSSFSPVFIRYGFNILRFKFLNLLLYPLCDRNFPVECPDQPHPKNGKIQTYLFFYFFSHPYISYKSISSVYIPLFLLFSFTYTFTYLLYEGSSMKFWSTGVPCLDVMGLDTPLESFCHTEGTVDK